MRRLCITTGLVLPVFASWLAVSSLLPATSAPAAEQDAGAENNADAGNKADAEKKRLEEKLPRIPPVEVDDALSTFAVARDFRLEQVAAEPLVGDPVDACFDAHGRMFVAEMHGYPFSQEPTRLNPEGGGKTDAGIIRMLEDTDGDGTMDRSVKFAEGIRWPTSVCCWKGGVFALAPPALWYFRDEDGDGVADQREVIYEGFGRGNVQAIANNLKWGLDHRIYGAGGRNPSVLNRDGLEMLKLGRRDFSFNPLTLEVRPETGGVQFGHSFDDWGRRFVCSNSNHIQQVVFPIDALNRNPAFQVRNPIRSIASGGAAAPVFRRSPAEPWRVVRTRRRVKDPRYKNWPATEKVPVGFFTSATGVTIYRGDAWPEEYRGQAFIGDVGGNLIHRKTMNRDPGDVVFVAKRADEGREFVASTDNWFRPVNFVNAPDGTLYVLDMYRETIEHPHSIPEDIKEYLDLEGGDERGRIYRIVGPDGQRKPVERLGDLTTGELVSRLASRNAWVRETAHRLLFERQDAEAVKPLRRLLKSCAEPLARMHALWSLSGLDELTADDVRTGLEDDHVGVREHAVRLSGPLLRDDAELSSRVRKLATDPDQRVRFQLALSIAHAKAEDRLVVLRGILGEPDSNADVRDAAMTSIGSQLPDIVAGLLREQFDNRPASDAGDRASQRTGRRSSAYRSWLVDAVRSIAVMKDPQALPAVFVEIAGADVDDEGEENSDRNGIRRLQSRLLLAIQSGLRQRGTSLQNWVEQPAGKTHGADLKAAVKRFADNARQHDAPQQARLDAIAVLSLAEKSAGRETLSALLSPEEPGAVQLAVVNAIGAHPADELAELILDRWRSLSPSVRKAATSALTRSVARAGTLLDAIDSGTIRAVDITPEHRQLLTGHPNSRIKERAAEVFQAGTNTDRARVVQEYGKALELKPDLTAGRKLFMKKCAVCHRVEDTGHKVGPDIVSVQNKSPSDLLIAIMDPNREAQPNFTAYSVLTHSGQVYNGIVAAESASTITLKKAEGKQDTIDRSEIEQFVSSGRTLMPDGLEKELEPQDIANVIGFIKSLKSPKRKQ